jgi:hypothetical protein
LVLLTSLVETNVVSVQLLAVRNDIVVIL